MNYPHGQVRCYHENGSLKFEGMCHYGEIEGQGKEYHKNGVLHYEGNFCKN